MTRRKRQIIKNKDVGGLKDHAVKLKSFLTGGFVGDNDVSNAAIEKD